MPSPYTVNLAENIERLKLDVQRHAALHGPRVATMADLRAALGQKADSNEVRLKPDTTYVTVRHAAGFRPE